MSEAEWRAKRVGDRSPHTASPDCRGDGCRRDAHIIGPDMRREYPNGPVRVTVTIQEIP